MPIKFCPPPKFWLATPLNKNHLFKSIIDFFLVVNRFRYNKVDCLANHPFYHFCHFCRGAPCITVLILVPGPGLALNGPAVLFIFKYEILIFVLILETATPLT